MLSPTLIDNMYILLCKKVIDIVIKYILDTCCFLIEQAFCKETISNKKYAISKLENSNMKELNGVNKKAMSTRCNIDIVQHCKVNDVNYILMVRGSQFRYGVHSIVDNINKKC